MTPITLIGFERLLLEQAKQELTIAYRLADRIKAKGNDEQQVRVVFSCSSLLNRVVSQGGSSCVRGRDGGSLARSLKRQQDLFR